MENKRLKYYTTTVQLLEEESGVSEWDYFSGFRYVLGMRLNLGTGEEAIDIGISRVLDELVFNIGTEVVEPPTTPMVTRFVYRTAATNNPKETSKRILATKITPTKLSQMNEI